jgi:hypothetical protein
MAQLFPVAKKLWVGPYLVSQDSNLSHGLDSPAVLHRHFLYRCFFLLYKLLFEVSHKAAGKMLLNFFLLLLLD